MTTQLPNKIARTGRVQQWIDNPTNRLPVSCTIFNVQDSMEGSDGIEASWRFVSHALRYGAGVAVHLSDLRPKGTTTNKGPDSLVASGPVSFGKIYSTLNEILRRGGTYRNGAVVLHLDINHPDILEFVQAERAELPWVKRCVNLTTGLWRDTETATKEAILRGIARGDIWLNKIKHDRYGNRIRGNVCLEVYLPSRGTCLLQHINLGACRIGDLRPAFRKGMSELCNLHGKTGVGESGEYLPSETDRQVGLGILGLANLLRRYGVTYDQFGRALEQFNKGESVRSAAYELVTQINAGSQHNVVPAQVNLVLDVRVNECYTNQEIADLVGQAPCEVTARSLRLQSSSIDNKHPLVVSGVAMGRNTYGSPTLSDQAALSCPSLKLGPGDSTRSHTADEFIYENEIKEAIRLYIELLDQVITS